MSRVSKHDALIATLAYADVFNYVLTRQEVSLWFLYYPVGAVTIPKHTGFSVTNRISPRQAGKWNIAARASRWLAGIPTIQLVGVTGGLAMNNAGRADDIDLFFIVADGTLWVTRMLATLLMDILGLRRHPKDQHVADKVCLNMFMTEGATALPQRDRDCFTAHEVLQMEPLFVRGNTYRRFLEANRWVKKFLPNAWKERNATWPMPNAKLKNSNYLFSIYHLAFIILEPLAKIIQLRYMQKHRTHEVITDTTLRFHPKDARIWVKRKLAARLTKFNIPLDKVFYAS